MRRSFTASLPVLLSISACTLEVTDETVSPLSYPSAPIEVQVRSNIAVADVDVIVPGLGRSPMMPTGESRYQAELPIELCSEIGEFEVEVTRRVFIRLVDRFPEIGRFTHPVSDLPEECEGFSQEASQTFVVDQRSDFPDDQPGDGVCFGTFGDIQGCSLRAAVMEANARLGTDLIRLPRGRYVLSRTGSESDTAPDDSIGDLDITDSVTIESISNSRRKVWDFLRRADNDRDENLTDDPRRDFDFVKIDGGGIDRVLHIANAGSIVRLRDLAIVNGNSDGLGGGILNAGLLSLERVAVVGNEMEGDATAIGGMGIRNDGSLIAEDVAITQNRAGRGISNPIGGALYNTGTARIRRALVAYNQARFGSAIHNSEDAVVELENVTIHDHQYLGSSVPVQTVVNNNGRMNLTFVTFSGHSNLVRTLLRNSASTDQLTLSNVLMLDNMASSNCDGEITTRGGNVTAGPCRMTGTTEASSNDNIDVRVRGLGGLVDDGGFTPVYPFNGNTSGAAFNPIDKGYLARIPFFDQRGEGFPRIVDGDGVDRSGGLPEVDPGAHEFQG